METEKNVAVVTLSTGGKHEINQEAYEQISQASPDDFILLPDWTSFKKSAVMEIEAIKEPVRYGQPGLTYEEVKQLPGIGYAGVIKSAKKKSHLEALARGLKKAKRRMGGIDGATKSTPNIDSLIQLARDCFRGIKSEKYKAKFETDETMNGYQKAKAAGVF